MGGKKKISKNSRLNAFDAVDDGTNKATLGENPKKLDEHDSSNHPDVNTSDGQYTSTTSDDEDEDAILLTDKVEGKIFKTLLDIQGKNPAIYDPNIKCFSDSDFDTDDNSVHNKNESKSLNYKDMVRETLLNEGAEALGSDSDDESDKLKEHKMNYQEEQEDLKNAFLSVANELDDDAEFFTKSDATDVLPERKLSSKKSAAIGSMDDSLISRYWASKETMDEDEEFLKDYILNQRWREDHKVDIDYAKQLRLEQEDEEHYDEAEEFEYKYNYRFEEAEGATIEGHPRTIEDSVRKVDDRRKKKRQEKKQNKIEEKIRREEELKRLKNLKKAEIAERMREIETNAGVQLDEDVVDLNAPFDPVQHEKDMTNILGSTYHEDAEDDEWNPGDVNVDDELWWLCDYCMKGIPAGHKHFDCNECDNYTLCETCVPLANHEHLRMTGKVVPPSCAPPKLSKDDLKKLEEEYYNLDYEDMIGDMKVRFKYRPVEPYKCDINTILEKSDKELNSIMPLSKLLTYDSDLPRPLKYKSDKRKGEHKHHGRMTAYNVNQDRLEAFSLKKGKKHKSQKKDTTTE
ncbi:KRI1-like C-terminal family protein [Babesia bovis T2Bo]|uniref:Kri1-like C-terminal domain-containing protein n=1 Tax=Babesia bovis TaxID=5865 RepID=A7ASY4_BABBO|nr:KRI1-like C-terminal family protein [Babesia bovis T2Bo]EDO06045.1 KRI1-like C-terminal family protein [Babesia bovis T2Bo]|eukprot:XP_001609613.1 hypothetical protein [Babesia bovis T2Bo]